MFKNYPIVIGGSAGAITALQNLLPRLPADFSAAILIVQGILFLKEPTPETKMHPID